ncbi:MAG: acyl carrier protein [Candidatus Paceibacterota bacterium]|jgi:acyl carrier protein
MNPQGMENKLRGIVAEYFGVNVSDVTDEKSFVEDFGANIEDMYNIVLDIEAETEIEISDEELDSIRTVGDLIQLVMKKDDRE